MAPPEGLIIQGEGASRKLQWKVGKLIGEGACASVHSLMDSKRKATDWVVKIVPLPTKITKKKMTLPERNARLLHFEELVYKNQFPELQGYVLPNLAPFDGPPSFGEADGFRFLIMEKMKAPLWDMVTDLLRSSGSSGKIDIGPIAVQLMTCVRVFHDKKHVLVDVKPENFMLAFHDHQKSNNHSKKKEASAADTIAGKIRVLDLGLVQNFKSPEGHRPDEGISEIVGTPLYSSLNLHNNHTPSRRDDCEAVGFVIAELIIRVVAAANGKADSYESGDMPSFLPWSLEKSDAAIGKVKAKQVNDAKSEFYKRMGDKTTAETMMTFFEATQAIKYKAEPDYDLLQDLLASLVVTVGQPQKKRAAAKSKSTSTRTTGRSAAATGKRTTRSKRAAAAIIEIDSEEEESDDEGTGESPTKRKKEDDEEEFEDASMEDVDKKDGDDDDDTFATAQEMDWEPETMKENKAKPTGRNDGVTLLAKEGPHAGERFDLKHGETVSVIIGSEHAASKAKKSAALPVWVLGDDGEMSSTHLRVELRSTRQRCSVKIFDLNSPNGTHVRKEKVEKGSSVQAFIGDTFTIGLSTFEIQEFTEEETVARKPKKSNRKAAAATAKKAPLAEKSQDADLVLVVVKGPHKGESFSLLRDVTETYNFGSSRSVARKGVPVILDGDDGIEKRHLRAQLQKGKKIPKVSITDLSESGGAKVNGRSIAKGKEVAAFANDTITIGETVLEVRRG